jgi:Flp pilus assembly pilin Flp
MSKQRKFGSRKGATFIEYALLAGLVAIVVAAAAMFFGDDLKKLFGATGQQTESVTENVQSVDLTSTLKNASEETGGGEKKK